MFNYLIRTMEGKEILAELIQELKEQPNNLNPNQKKMKDIPLRKYSKAKQRSSKLFTAMARDLSSGMISESCFVNTDKLL